MGSLDGDSIDGDFPYDNMSQSSYGSHKNRNFESRSHQGVGSLDELRNQEENEKLRLLMMNGSSATNGGGVSALQIIYILTSPGIIKKIHQLRYQFKVFCMQVIECNLD